MYNFYYSSLLSRAIPFHHAVIAEFSVSDQSSSSMTTVLCEAMNNLSSKSRNSLMVERPELRESATYRLNNVSVPGGLGGGVDTRLLSHFCSTTVRLHRSTPLSRLEDASAIQLATGCMHRQDVGGQGNLRGEVWMSRF